MLISNKTQCMWINNTNSLTLFRQVMVVHYKNNMTHTKVCVQIDSCVLHQMEMELPPCFKGLIYRKIFNYLILLRFALYIKADRPGSVK
jgi:hypothetical protein